MNIIIGIIIGILIIFNWPSIKSYFDESISEVSSTTQHSKQETLPASLSETNGNSRNESVAPSNIVKTKVPENVDSFDSFK